MTCLQPAPGKRRRVSRRRWVVCWCCGKGSSFPTKGSISCCARGSGWRPTAAIAGWLIAGTGAPELLEQIREQVKSLGLKRVQLQLRFISVRELMELYRTADVVVYPYRAITTSGALATGMALGKTIVASDLPAFRELLTHRESALLIDPEDSVKFADVLIELAQDKDLRERLAGRVRAMNFGEQSWISIAKDTVVAYESALLSSSHSSAALAR